MSRLMVVVWLAAVQPSTQDAAAVKQLVNDLAHENAAIRDKALATLKALPYGRMEELRELRKSMTERESVERLEEVLRHLTGKEGEALYQEGRLKEALLKLAESQGARDPSADVDRRGREAREFLLRCFKDSEGKRKLFPPDQILELRNKHGRYALPPLMEFLGEDDYRHKAFEYLRLGLEYDAIPAICGALRGPDGPASAALCALLGALGRNDNTVKTLKKVMDDPGRNQEVRDQARTSLVRLRVLEEDK